MNNQNHAYVSLAYVKIYFEIYNAKRQAYDIYLSSKELFRTVFSSPGQSPGRAIVLPPASALALALAGASALANVKVLC